MASFALLVAALLGAIAISSAVTSKPSPTDGTTAPWWELPKTSTQRPATMTTMWWQRYQHRTRRPSTTTESPETTTVSPETTVVPTAKMWWQRYQRRTRRPSAETTGVPWKTRDEWTTSEPWGVWTTRRRWDDWTTRRSWDDWTTRRRWDDWRTRRSRDDWTTRRSWDDWTTRRPWDDRTTPSWEDGSTQSWDEWSTPSWDDWTTRSWEERTPSWLGRLESELRRSRKHQKEMEKSEELLKATADRTTAILAVVIVIAGFLLVMVVSNQVCMAVQRSRKRRSSDMVHPVGISSIRVDSEPSVNPAGPLLPAEVMPHKDVSPPAYVAFVQVDVPPQTTAGDTKATVGEVSHV